MANFIELPVVTDLEEAKQIIQNKVTQTKIWEYKNYFNFLLCANFLERTFHSEEFWPGHMRSQVERGLPERQSQK